MARERRFSAEVRERAVRMVQEPEASHPSRWAAVKSIAGKIGISPETLRKWLRRAEIDQGKRPGTTSADQSRIKDLEREFRELKRANEFLRKASAFFAQAEFDRRGK